MSRARTRIIASEVAKLGFDPDTNVPAAKMHNANRQAAQDKKTLPDLFNREDIDDEDDPVDQVDAEELDNIPAVVEQDTPKNEHEELNILTVTEQDTTKNESNSAEEVELDPAPKKQKFGRKSKVKE
jgi:hypothetical protein